METNSIQREAFTHKEVFFSAVVIALKSRCFEVGAVGNSGSRAGKYLAQQAPFYSPNIFLYSPHNKNLVLPHNSPQNHVRTGPHEMTTMNKIVGKKDMLKKQANVDAIGVPG